MATRASRVLAVVASLAGVAGGAASCDTLIGIQSATARPGVTSLAAGAAFACALVADGTVWCWGADDHQQLGHLALDADVPCKWAAPDGGTNVGLCSPTPTQVGGLHDVKQLALGSDFACALLADGDVDCWGSNDTGQLGPIDAGDFSYTRCPSAFFDAGTITQAQQCTPVPTKVQGIPPATAIAAGGLHACASTVDGVYCWGNSAMNILGTGTGGNGPVLASRIPPATALSSPLVDPPNQYIDNTCALVSPTSTVCWGPNDLTDDGCPNQPCPLTTSGVTSIHTGYLYGCTLGGGALTCWGENSFYTFDSMRPQNMTPYASDYTSVLSSSDQATIAQFEGRSTHALALDQAGRVWAWGDNRYGELGTPPMATSLTACSGGQGYCVNLPAAVALDDGGAMKTIATGVGFSLALGADGTVWAWGQNREAQLGTLADGGPCVSLEAGAEPCSPTPQAIAVPP